MNSQQILQLALTQMVDKIDAVILSSHYQGEPIKMVLAGGMAVNYYCGTRYTADVDASFSRKILLPTEELIVHYQKADGDWAYLYFDTNFSLSLALMHENYAENVIDYQEINTIQRSVAVFVLSPVDLALSKIARFSDQDVADILALATDGYFTADALNNRANEALKYYIGNIATVRHSIDMVCEKIIAVQQTENITKQPLA